MKTMKILTIGALLIIISAFAVINLDGTSFGGYGIGDTATDFKLKNVDETMVSLSDYEDAQGFIVVFTCNTCPFSVAYEDRIIALNAKYEPKGYPVIAINPNNPEAQPKDSFEDMQQRAASKDFTFPYLYDDSHEVYATYGATRTPHVFVLAKENGGNVVKYIGAIDDNSKDAGAVTEKYVENAVDALLAGNEVNVKETKAIGCTIKK